MTRLARISEGRRLLAAAAICLVGIVVLAGCGSSSSSSSSSTSEETTEATETTNESGGSPEAAGQEVNLAMVETFSAIPFYVSAKEGAEAAASEDGAVKLTVQAPATANGTNEATMAANLLANEPEGFGPNPCILPAWGRVMKEMAEQVPNENVIAWNCTPVAEPGQASPVPTFVGVSNKETGRMLAETLVEASGLKSSSTGSILVGNCQEGVPILDDRDTGAEEVFKKLLPKADIVHFGTNAEQAKATAAWSSELSNHTDTIIAFGPCDQDSAALLSLASKSPGEFAIGSVDPNEAELKALQAGTFTAAVSSQPWTVGYVTVDLLAAGARGTAAPEGWIDTGILPITEANAAEFEKASTGGAPQAEFFLPYAKKAIEEAESGANVKPLDAAFE